jgi:hypothetical protein
VPRVSKLETKPLTLRFRMPLDAQGMRHALDIEHPIALFGEVSLCNLYG